VRSLVDLLPVHVAGKHTIPGSTRAGGARPRRELRAGGGRCSFRAAGTQVDEEVAVEVLHTAAQVADGNLCKKLVSEGNLVVALGGRSVDVARDRGHSDVVRFLAMEALLAANAQPAMGVAMEALRTITQSPPGSMPLHLAALVGDVDLFGRDDGFAWIDYGLLRQAKKDAFRGYQLQYQERRCRGQVGTPGCMVL